MQGFYLGKDGEHIEKAMIESNEVSLLAKGDGTEVILQKFNAGKSFYVFPSEHKEALEFFYIVEGECVCEPKGLKLKAGDFFYTQNLQDTIFFKALKNMKILWMCSQPAFHHMSESIDELIKIVKQIEEKDRYTYHHSRRVQKYSMRIAKELVLSTDKLENLYFASLFHDIGKIDIDEKILNKTGKLTQEEFDIIKQHAELGYDMVKSTYYDKVGDIILQHHERLDGSGYPFGLKQGEILQEAQIIAVADTYDAMTSDRSYRKGIDSQLAMEEIKKYTGILYDENIVLAFERALARDET